MNERLKIINSILIQYGFIKKRSVYYRILNKSIFQALYFTRISNVWSFAFESIPLYAEEISKDELAGIEKYRDGMNVLYLIDYKEKKEYYIKDELIEVIIEKMELILKKLDDLYNLTQHIIHIENGQLRYSDIVIAVPLNYYLYDKQFDKAKKIINDNIYTYKDCMVQSNIRSFANKEMYESEDLARELFYMDIKQNEELLRKLNNNTYFPPDFNDIYNKNVLVLNEFFNYDFIKRFE